MATQTVEFECFSGRTLTAKLFTPGSDTEVASASATEGTNDKGTYRAAFTDVPAGTYRLTILDSGVAVAKGRVKLALATADYFPFDEGAVGSVTAGVTLATSQPDYAPAKAGDAMTLQDDAITASKFDESTAFPLKAADTGSTTVARMGAGSGTLETLSDELALLESHGDSTWSTATGFSTHTPSDVVTAMQAVAGDFKADVSGLATQTDISDLQTHGDSTWATATGFSTHAAADVWAVGTRTLTAGTNIVLAKGTGITGFNDLDAAGVRTAVGLAAANLDTQLGDIPTVSELEARTLPAADYFDPSTDEVTVGTNSDKTGYALATATPTAEEVALEVRSELAEELAHIDADISSRLSAGDYTAPDNSGIASIVSTIGVAGAGLTSLGDARLQKLNVSGTLAHTDNASSFKADVSGLATSTALQDVQEAVDNLALEALDENTGIPNIVGRLDVIQSGVGNLVSPEGKVVSTGDATDTTFRTNLTFMDGAFDDLQVKFTSGALHHQCKTIAGYDADTKAITVSEPFTQAPANNDQFVVIGIHTHPVGQIQQGLAKTTDLPANFAALVINETGSIGRVLLVDTTTTNMDMRGTDGANTTTPPTANQNADALLDRANAIDGQTVRAALRIVAAVVAGKVSGAGTETEVFKGLDGTTTRATVTADEDGNRTEVAYG